MNIKEMKKKADLVFEKTLDIVGENKNRKNLIEDLWEFSNLGEQFNYTNYELKKYEDISIDDISENDKEKIKMLSEKRIEQKLKYYTLFLKIIEKYKLYVEIIDKYNK